MTPKLKRVVRLYNDSSKKLVTPAFETWLRRNPNVRLSKEHAEMVIAMLQARQRDRTQSFSASARGACIRAQMFTYIGVPQAVSLDTVGALRMIDGSWKHISMQVMLLASGAIKRIEVPIHVPKWRLRGSLDGDNVDRGFGFELKTTQAFNYFLEKGPASYHRLQIGSYLMARPDLERFSLMYWDVRTREYKEYIIERDKGTQAIVRRELEVLNEHAEHQTLPPVLKECMKGKGATFNGCSYSHICLRLANWDEAAQEAGRAAIANAKGTKAHRPKPTNVQSGRRYRIVARPKSGD